MSAGHGPANPHAEGRGFAEVGGNDPYAAEHRWIRIRLIGWGLIGAWQILSLASEFLPIDLESRVIRIVGKVFGIIGLAFVAYGFERLVELRHEHDWNGGGGRGRWGR